MSFREAMIATVVLAMAPVASARWGVVADPAFPREKICERFGADAKFFAPSELPAIRAFAAAGGRNAVAYCGDAALGEFMGVKPGPWRKVDAAALGNSSFVKCTYQTGCAFVPGIPQGNPRHARVKANLLDSSLRDTGLAGVVETDRGVWYAHAVPPADMTGGRIAPPPGTLAMRAVWSDGRPLAPGGWPVEARRLARSGFNAIFLNSSAMDFDRIAADCRAAGLRVHAWIECFSKGRRPDRRAVRDAAFAEVMRFARKPIDGVELDYLRFPSGALKGAGARAAGRRAVTEFLVSLAGKFRRVAGGKKLSAAIYPRPRTQEAVGQDAADWIRRRLVDFVSPMCYTPSAQEFRAWMSENVALVGAGNIVIGIGCGASESRLDDAGIRAQFAHASAAGLAGAALYRLDAELSTRLR